MKALSNLATHDIIFHPARKVMTTLNPHCINVFSLNKRSVSTVTHHPSPSASRDMTNLIKPTRSLALIEFARGLNPNGAELRLHHLIGEFVRKRLSQSCNMTDKSQRDETALSQQRFHFPQMAAETS